MTFDWERVPGMSNGPKWSWTAASTTGDGVEGFAESYDALVGVYLHQRLWGCSAMRMVSIRVIFMASVRWLCDV